MWTLDLKPIGADGGESQGVVALAAEVRFVNSSRIHMIQGHSVHDPECEHCMMGRMRHKPRRRVRGPREDFFFFLNRNPFN